MLHDIYISGYMVAGVALLLIAGCLAAVSYRLRKLDKDNRKLRHDMAEMDMAYANAPLGLATIDRELRYVRINKLLAHLNGISVEAHIGQTIHAIVPDVAKQAEDRFLQVLRTGEPLLGMVVEGMTSSQPGVPRFWRENVYPVFANGGEVIGLSVSVEDITEEKRLNDALKASELRERRHAAELEVVMNAAPAAIFISHDVTCNQVIGNAEANRMLHLRPGQNASANPPNKRPFAEYANGAPVSPDRLPMQMAAATGAEVRGVELTYQFDSGETAHVLSNAAPLINDAGQVVGAVGAFIDVTAQRKAAEVLMLESQRKDEFLATLAHELRNPLAPIQNGLELMKLMPAASPSFGQARDIVARQFAHLVRLIDDLLDMSRITSGKLELKKEHVTVGAIIDSAMEVSRLHVEASGHALEVGLPPSPLHVEADPVRMAQVVSNLLNNAAKYTPEGGRIRLVVEEDGGDAVIRVIDNGIGIEPEMLPRVFEMFSQVESARNRRKGGLGIGLSLARQLVEMHGGTLTAESAGPGAGSTFTVRLPCLAVAAGEAPKPARGSGAPVPSGGRRILILDDNVDAAQTLGSLLELGGNTITLAYTGQDAVRKAREFRPEIAFLDIGLPDISGLDVVRALRKEASLQGATLVALTGWGSPKDRLDCEEAGFDFHLTKPVTMAAIQSILPGLPMPSDR